MQNPVKTLVIKFNNEIYPDEIDCFRGAVIHAMDGANVLFHNHLEGNRLLLKQASNYDNYSKTLKKNGQHNQRN